jgi:dihydrofolate reductase
MPKFVATNTVQSATWNSTVIRGDVAAEVGRLKEQPGESRLKYGTGDLDKTLMQYNLVDEFHFWMFPVAAGKGDRLFDGFDLTHLKLMDSTRFHSGIVVLVYGPK